MAHISSTPDSAILGMAASRNIDLAKLPQHVAIIMDGNGRWAQSQGLPRLFGHNEGYKALRHILLACSDLGVRYLTVYAFSSENWTRPEEEVDGLMKLIEHAARAELEELHANNVRVQVAGRLDELPEPLRNALQQGIELTAANTGITFILAVNYGGRAEIVDAVKKLAREGKDLRELTEEDIWANLYLPDVPEPDLMVRTAGEVRWSNFLIWQAAYSELYVSAKTWPEFTPDEFLNALCEFQSRTRKFGAI